MKPQLDSASFSRPVLSNAQIADRLASLAQLLSTQKETPTNRYFNILGHATGRLHLKRPGYEIDIDRIIAHARRNGCFFEINSSPDRLDLSAENARAAGMAGAMMRFRLMPTVRANSGLGGMG